MKVSVIIPTYKRSDFLIRAIESVVNQTYSDIEIIVVDDNGIGMQQEVTRQIVLMFSKVKLITYSENKGACFARNEGVLNSNGEILMFLDDDDYYFENKVESHLGFFLSVPDIDACLCSMKRMDQNGNYLQTPENFPRGQNLKDYMLKGNCFTTMIAIKKQVFDEIGGFDEIDRFQDKYFMYKFFKNNKKVSLFSDQLFVFVDHNKDRTSIINYRKAENAYKILHGFEIQNKSVLSNAEFQVIENKYFLNLSRIRTRANIFERMKGIIYLIKSNMFFNNIKLLIRLLLTDKYYNFIKGLFYFFIICINLLILR